ncbi:molybdenum cofactor guanylyltransferase MobA [Hylemonella sp. W303a]|uniref:molybdenum cofactor guanylyltransferase MobA n=1 Tax=Hylemonella sp. W303a TaxID=3389873 RepID=UPI00396B2B29
MADANITGLILAGGRGSRMGGVDKGLQAFEGEPMVAHALRRLRPQVSAVAISANRHLPAYEAYGVPVWPDLLPDYPGPLAGLLSGLTHAATPWVLTVPCDAPRFPTDLASRLYRAVRERGADIALPVTDRLEPAFCLVATSLRDDLAKYLGMGERKVEAWARQHRWVEVPYRLQGNDAFAFANLNTEEELKLLEQQRMPDHSNPQGA